MKKLFAIIMLFTATATTACNSQNQAQEYPSTPKEVAQKFMELYTAGNPAAAEYVKFDGRYIMELALTPEIARKERFPEELAKQKSKAPVKVECISERITTDEDNGNPDLPVAYVKCKVNNDSEYLTLYQAEGQWKVDITVKWADDWFDGQIY